MTTVVRNELRHNLSAGPTDRPGAGRTNLPSVGVVIPTHNRPQLMRRALASILAQRYPGEIKVTVVYDGAEPEAELALDACDRRVRVCRNGRTTGLAGARNTGILALDTDLVAFCDDDDYWLQGKLMAQVERLTNTSDAFFVTTSARFEMPHRSVARLAGKSDLVTRDLVRSRLAMVTPSSYLFSRELLIDRCGLVSEDIPRSMGEDWELLLRVSREAAIVHVDRPLVAIRWAQGSAFNDSWLDKNAAHHWLLQAYPEFSADRIGLALQYGKLAFGHAVLGHRALALAYAVRAWRANRREPRTLLALAVLCGVSGPYIQHALSRCGHGV
jgi:glycosyltransferase involved in cell wall biosynthesis